MSNHQVMSLSRAQHNPGRGADQSNDPSLWGSGQRLEVLGKPPSAQKLLYRPQRLSQLDQTPDSQTASDLSDRGETAIELLRRFIRKYEGLMVTSILTNVSKKRYRSSPPFMSKNLQRSSFLTLDLLFPSEKLLVLNHFQLECFSDHFFLAQNLTVRFIEVCFFPGTGSVRFNQVSTLQCPLYGGDSMRVYQENSPDLNFLSNLAMCPFYSMSALARFCCILLILAIFRPKREFHQKWILSLCHMSKN